MGQKVELKDVFLGGTCNDSHWRDEFVKHIKSNLTWFNPVVKDWNENAKQIEDEQKKHSRYKFYCLTPKQIGFYSIAEITEDAIVNSKETILCILNEDGDVKWTPGQKKSIDAIEFLIRKYGVSIFYNLTDAAKYLDYIFTSK